ncbi:MAG: hypothetical protein NDJ89_15730 [Oligoflexia bacterium]|nr:hypothetical protein [Oligoflexia bacterium]
MTGTPQSKSATPDATAELDQIMNEIEELQQEMTSPKAQAAAPPSEESPETSAVEEDLLSEFRASGGQDAGMEETLGDLKDESGTGGGLLDQETPEASAAEEAPEESLEEPVEEPIEEPVEEVQPLRSKPMTIHPSACASPEKDESTEEGTLTMTLTGNMTLRLKYEFEGQEVTVGFQDGSLRVQLADGTEFKVPVGRARALRRVA